MHFVDIDALGRRKHFDWFNSFDDPTFSLNVKMDVTNVRLHAKAHEKSFFY